MSKKNKNTNTNIKSILEQVRVRDFYGHRKIFFAFSALLMAAVVALCFIRGVNASIEFKGGTLSTYAYDGSVSAADINKTASEYLNTLVNVTTGETYTGENQKTFTLGFNLGDGKSFSGEMQ